MTKDGIIFEHKDVKNNEWIDLKPLEHKAVKKKDPLKEDIEKIVKKKNKKVKPNYKKKQKQEIERLHRKQRRAMIKRIFKDRKKNAQWKNRERKGKDKICCI